MCDAPVLGVFMIITGAFCEALRSPLPLEWLLLLLYHWPGALLAVLLFGHRLDFGTHVPFSFTSTHTKMTLGWFNTKFV